MLHEQDNQKQQLSHSSHSNTVYSGVCKKIGYIYRSRMVDPIFLPTYFTNFAEMVPKNTIIFIKSQ